MKYRVKEIRNDDLINGILVILLWWLIPLMNTNPTWEIQYKKHWWNRWKTCDSYDRKEDAYRYLINYETNGKCILKNKMKFPHNRIKGKYVTCFLEMGKINPVNKNYNEGNHYYAGYKPASYAKYYYCSYGKSYEDAITKLWCDLEIQKLLHKID